MPYVIGSTVAFRSFMGTNHTCAIPRLEITLVSAEAALYKSNIPEQSWLANEDAARHELLQTKSISLEGERLQFTTEPGAGATTVELKFGDEGIAADVLMML
jgi:hypothetical protein